MTATVQRTELKPDIVATVCDAHNIEHAKWLWNMKFRKVRLARKKDSACDFCTDTNFKWHIHSLIEVQDDELYSQWADTVESAYSWQTGVGRLNTFL